MMNYKNSSKHYCRHYYNKKLLGHQLLEKQFQHLKKKPYKKILEKPKQTDLLKELQQIKQIRENYLYILQSSTDIPELLQLFAGDEMN